MLATLETKIDIADGAENSPICFDDDILHEKLKDFQYVCCSIPGPGTSTDMFEESLQGCTCPEKVCDQSTETKCSCMKYGPAYTVDGKLNTRSQHTDTCVLNECNSDCSCSQTCSNRVVQRGITIQLQVFWCEQKGLCLRTLDTIERGQFVCQYAGEVLTKDEAKRRIQLQTKEDKNYIFTLNEHFTSTVLTTYIDPCYRGNVGRFINHSCDPNLVVLPVRVQNLVPKVCMFAARDINVNEELTYDYGHSIGNEQNVPVNLQKVCKCNSKNCKGFLPFDASVLT